MAERRLRIAFFSDLAGIDSLSAYCARLLLPKLNAQFSVEAFSDSFTPQIDGVSHHHYLKAYQRHRAEPFDVFFYQLEDGRRSRFVRSCVGIMPGVTWFHDLFFLDLGPEATHTSPWENSIRQFYDSSLPCADRAVAPHQLWPRAYREVSLSPINLFSSRWSLNESKSMLSRRLEGELGSHCAQCLKIPVEVGELAPLPPRSTLRIAACSAAGLEGRAHKLLAALRGLKHKWHLTWAVEGGDLKAAETLVREFEVGERVTLSTDCSPTKWADLLASAHVALHLRTSCFGHLAPFVQISLASGRLTVVSDMAQGEDLPDQIVCKVAPGTTESAQLHSILSAACSMEIASATAAARAYIASEHSPHKVAQELSQLLEAAAISLRVPMRRWDGLYSAAKSELLHEVADLMGSSADAGLGPFSRILAPASAELFSR